MQLPLTFLATRRLPVERVRVIMADLMRRLEQTASAQEAGRAQPTRLRKARTSIYIPALLKGSFVTNCSKTLRPSASTRKKVPIITLSSL
jgi:hypothetical protein